MSRIWLMMALPCSEAEFVERLSSTGVAASDYLAQFDLPDAERTERAAHWRTQWENGVERMLGAPYRAVVECAERLGCTVVRRATLADLRDAAARAQIIVVVAHWKDAAFPATDFAPDFDNHIAGQLAPRSEPLALWLKRTIGPRRFLFWTRRGTPPRDAFRQSLHARIGDEKRVEMPRTTAARRRDVLDTWFADCLRPGNRLELSDGLHSKEAVAEALSGFEGLVDLTICTSTYLGDHIGARSRQRTRTVQFVELQEPAEAAFRLRHVLQLATKAAVSIEAYLSARMTISSIFPRAIDEALAERGIN